VIKFIILSIISFVVFQSLVMCGEPDSREEHIQRNEQESFDKTIYVMKKMNAFMERKVFEDLRNASDKEIESFCIEKNLNLEDVKYVIGR
jgi:hypothetical protein